MKVLNRSGGAAIMAATKMNQGEITHVLKERISDLAS
jgi:hypothetical protein